MKRSIVNLSTRSHVVVGGGIAGKWFYINCIILSICIFFLSEKLRLLVINTIIKTHSFLILGLTTAFNLLQQPKTSVTLVEKAFDVAQGASRKNGCLLCPSLDYPWTSKSQIVDIKDPM
jgi:hypothetical protein